MGGGSKSTSTSQQQSNSGSGQTWANPYAVAGVNEIMDVYKANKPNLDAQVAAANDLSQKLTSGYDTAASAFGDASALGKQGAGYYGDVLSGKYLSGNPYLDAIINQNNASISDEVNSQFTSAGRYGSGAQTGVLTQKLADAANALRYNDYNNQMTRMDTAAQGALAQQQAAAQNQAQAAGLALAQQQAAAQLPYAGTQELAQALSALFSGGTSSGTSSSVTKQSPNLFGGLGSILSGVAAF